MNASGTGLGLPLGSLSDSGRPLESRLNDAAEVIDLVGAVIRANEKRIAVDATVKGLVDGNPPYRKDELAKNNQSWRANANFREAEAFLDQGKSSFYDLYSESPTYATAVCEYGSTEQSDRCSRIITEEFDRLNREDHTLDYTIQCSQHDMVLYRMGPVVWYDEWDFRGEFVRQSRVLLPDGTESRLDKWEVAVILADVLPHELYRRILHPSREWDSAAVKKAILAAAPNNGSADGSGTMEWEETQQRIRNNDLCWSYSRSKVIPLAHVFYRELPRAGEDEDNEEGPISHCIVTRDQSAGTDQKFLYRKLRRFKTWRNVICPFYYDKGDGTHHSVKGMGVKFFSMLELANRTRNAAVDMAFMPPVMFVPQTAEAQQKLNIMNMGPYAVLPRGLDIQQTPHGNRMEGPLAVTRELLSVTTANLAQYRQNLQRSEGKGNPPTATQVQWQAQNQSILGKTQLARYYEQLDDFWAERYRRASNPDIAKVNPGGIYALEFQRRCKDRGVPAAAMKSARVHATRVVGQGSAFLREQALGEVLTASGMLGERGKQYVLQSWVAAKMGQRAVESVFPAEDQQRLPDVNIWQATMEHTSFKLGNSIPVIPEQDHAIHGTTHLQAAVQALNSLEMGGSPQEVLVFIDQVGAHTAGHIGYLQADPTQKAQYDQLKEVLKEIASAADELRGKLGQSQEQQQEMQQQQQEQVSEAQLKEQELQHKIQLANQKQAADDARKNAKTAAEIQRKAITTRQDLAIKDATAAANLRASRKQAAGAGKK